MNIRFTLSVISQYVNPAPVGAKGALTGATARMIRKEPAQDKSTDRLPETKIHELLSCRRRSDALDILDAAGPMTVGDLADRMSVVEFGETYGYRERKRIYVALHQHHIPKLQDYGVIRETEDGELATTRRAKRILWYHRNNYRSGPVGSLISVLL